MAFAIATGWTGPPGQDPAMACASHFSELCYAHRFDPLDGLDLPGFSAMMDEDLRSLGGTPELCTTQELAAFATIARGTAVTPGPPALISTQSSMPSATQPTGRPAAAAPETICDSDSDLPDDMLSAALALAFPVIAHTTGEPIRAQAVAAVDVPADLPILDPRAVGGLRLAALLVREPCFTWESKVRHLRDSFQLPPRLALALVLLEPDTLSYIYDGRSIFEANHCPTHGARNWYTLMDMIDPFAGEIALAMMNSESHRGTALSLIAL